MRLSAVNALTLAEFIGALGWIFEESPWVAERAWSQRPFSSRDALHAAMRSEVERASRDEQLALLRSHPDLGTRAHMSAASVGEQSGAGLGQLTAAEHAELTELNRAYCDKFGFPFLFAVKGSGKLDIMEALRKRIHSLPVDEFNEALAQVFRIAQFRLEDTIDDA